jgi:DNA-3-methyladenine glycosylase I
MGRYAMSGQERNEQRRTGKDKPAGGPGAGKKGPVLKRCPWAEAHELLRVYHDTEWGVPVRDDRKHFEFLCLEAFQAGLSWLIVLKKREAFREAFAGFDPEQVRRFGRREIENCLGNPAIIRNRRKIEAAVHNAARFLEVQDEFGTFDSYIWSFVGGKPVVNAWREMPEVPATTGLSDTVSADLKKRGFRFMGSTVVYAHLQAIGVVNDHLADCFRYRDLDRH